jgi:crotonobetainyl-CoA:carnitine CoA-transferase CaiB-like acyl-CoA transferase
VLNYLASGTAATPATPAWNIALSALPRRGRHVSIGAGNDRSSVPALGVLDSPSRRRSPLRHNQARVANRASLAALMSAATTFRDALLAALEAAGVPAGPINSVADVFADPRSCIENCASTCRARVAAPCPASGRRSGCRKRR